TPQALAVVQAVDVNAALRAPEKQEPSVGRKGKVMRRGIPELPQQPARVDLPNADRAVHAAGGEPAGRFRGEDLADALRVSRQAPHQLSGPRVPEEDLLADGTGAGDKFRVRGKGRGHDWERPSPSSAPRTPHTQLTRTIRQW